MNYHRRFKDATKPIPLNLCFLIIALLCTSFFNQSHAANLQDALGSARSNNRNIKLELIKLKSTKVLKTEAISEFLPDISANAQYGNRNSSYKDQTTDASTKQRVQEIRLEQPLFDGFRSVSKFREAKYKIKSAKSQTRDKIQEISFAAVQSYCNLFRYSKFAELQKENQEFGDRFLKLVQKRKDVQIIDKSEIIKFTYEAAINDEKYLNSLNELSKAKFDYQNIVGRLDENLSQPIITKEKFDHGKVLDSALASNNIIKSSHYEYLASKASYNAEKSNFSPTISLSASASKEEQVVYLNNQDLNNRTVFINISVPIFQKGTEYASLSRAKYEKQAAREQYEISREEIIKEVNQTLEEYRFYSQMNQSNKKLWDMAKDRMAIFNKRLKSRIEDPIEVIRARIEANDRQINYINSQMDLVISYYKIKYFLGEI
ncbi:MAG: outer membrane protein [Rickettsiales bacterium]|jgi:outer membrane protein